MNDNVALLDIGVDLGKRADAERNEILLDRDVDGQAGQLMTQRLPLRPELVGDAGEEQLDVLAAHRAAAGSCA